MTKGSSYHRDLIALVVSGTVLLLGSVMFAFGSWQEKWDEPSILNLHLHGPAVLLAMVSIWMAGPWSLIAAVWLWKQGLGVGRCMSWPSSLDCSCLWRPGSLQLSDATGRAARAFMKG